MVLFKKYFKQKIKRFAIILSAKKVDYMNGIENFFAQLNLGDEPYRHNLKMTDNR